MTATWIVIAVLGWQVERLPPVENADAIPVVRPDESWIDVPVEPPLGPNSTAATRPIADFPSEAAPATGDWGVAVSYLGGGGERHLGMMDLRLSRAWFAGDSDSIWSSLRVAPGVGMHLWNGPDELLLPNRLFDLYVDLSASVWQHEHGDISLGLTPGIYSDLQDLNSNSFQLTGWVNGTYVISQEWTLTGGVAVVRQLKSRWLPMGGVVWTPTPDWQVDLLFPRPRLARRLWQTDDGDAWAFIAGNYGGGSWAIDDPLVGESLIQYSDLRLTAGANFWRASGRELLLEFGYVFSRQVAIDDSLVDTPTDAWLVQLTWAF